MNNSISVYGASAVPDVAMCDTMCDQAQERQASAPEGD